VLEVSLDPAAMYQVLLGVLKARGKVMTAYSGGVDSTLLAVAARNALGKDFAPAAIADSPSLPRHELEAARELAARHDIQLHTVQTDEISDHSYQQNDSDRCYFCKTHLYKSIKELALQMDIPFIACGTNHDDLSDYRPGQMAADQAQVIAPLIEAKLGKQQVRVLARFLGLANWDKPSSPCLASRVPYGTPVTIERLDRIERAENILRSLGFRQFRVRHHEQLARIELPLSQVNHLLDDDIRVQIINELKKIGYLRITLDLEGFRSGSGNDQLGTSNTLKGGMGKP